MGNGEIIKEPWSAAGVLKSAEGRGHLDASACRAGAAPAAFPVLSAATQGCSRVTQSPCLSESDPDQ